MRRLAVTVLLDDEQSGVAARLWLERVENGVGTIYPDPSIMAFVRYDADFAQAIEIAWQVMPHPGDVDVRWWLDGLRGPQNIRAPLPLLLSGPSLGAAFAVGLHHALNPASPDLDDRWTIVGSIIPDGTIGKVGGYERKLLVAQSLSLRVIVPSDDYPCLAAEWREHLNALEQAAHYHQASNIARTWLRSRGTGRRARDVEFQQQTLLSAANLIYGGGKLDAKQGRKLIRSILYRIAEHDRIWVEDRQIMLFADVLYGHSFSDFDSIPQFEGRARLKKAYETIGNSAELAALKSYAQWVAAAQWRKHGDMVRDDEQRLHYSRAKRLLKELTTNSSLDPYIRALSFTELAKIALKERDEFACETYSRAACDLVQLTDVSVSEWGKLYLPYWVKQARAIARETRLRMRVAFGIHDDEAANVYERNDELPVDAVAAAMSEAQIQLRSTDAFQWSTGLRGLWSARLESVDPNGFPRFVQQSVRVLRRFADGNSDAGAWLREEAVLESYCPNPRCRQWTEWRYDAGVRDFVCSYCGGRLL